MVLEESTGENFSRWGNEQSLGFSGELFHPPSMETQQVTFEEDNPHSMPQELDFMQNLFSLFLSLVVTSASRT